MSNAVAAPRAYVDVYPTGNPPLQLRGAHVLSLTVEKNIYDEVGHFAVELPPGGPNGANARPSWAEAIPPMSVVVIGLARWQYSSVVMVGVVTRVRYAEQFRSGSATQRRVVIEGQDLAFFLNQLSYNALVVAAGIGAAVGFRSGSAGYGLAALLGGGLMGGPGVTPAAWANAYSAKVVRPLFDKTMLPYLGGGTALAQALAMNFEEWPGYSIPMAASFIGDMGSYGAMLRRALQFPFYELLAITAPFGHFSTPAPSLAQPFQIAEIRQRANFYLIGRRNPVPNLTVSVAGNNFTYDGLDTSRWNALPEYTPDSGAIETALEFSMAGARNWFVLNPTYLNGAAFGGDLSNISPFVALFGSAIDLASVERYGLLELNLDSQWFAGIDLPQGIRQDYPQLVADLLCWAASYHSPLPLMASGRVTYPLRPDVVPGCRWVMPAFNKQSAQSGLWQFYIEGMRHDFVFGGQSTSTLTITRGLPNEVYGDAAAGGLLERICTGNAVRKGGQYVALPGPPNLQPFNVINAKETIAAFQQMWAVPQAQP